jgi:hypothetical protein
MNWRSPPRMKMLFSEEYQVAQEPINRTAHGKYGENIREYSSVLV